MTAYQKPDIIIDEIQQIVKQKLGSDAVEITPLEGGNLSSVFSFKAGGKGYVIKFSDLADAYGTERFVSDLLARQEVIHFPRCLAMDQTGPLTYVIMEKVEGNNLASFPAEDQHRQLPELIHLLTKLAEVDVTTTCGYGWIKPDGNGSFQTWKDFVEAAFAEDQTGTFWENWHELYHTTCLERDVFEEIYQRLMHLVSYCEPHRRFVHGDFHQWNILSDGERITGIIDGLYMYGDPLIDLATLDRHMPWAGVVQAYREQMDKDQVVIPHFEERLKAAYYFKGLDGLRFYAKMGWSDAYQGMRHFLLGLE